MIQRFWIHSCCAVLFLGLLGAAFYSSKKYVAQKLAFPSDPPRVVLKNRPAWMSDLLAEEITRMARPIGAHSAFDQQMLVDINRIPDLDYIREDQQLDRLRIGALVRHNDFERSELIQRRFSTIMIRVIGTTPPNEVRATAMKPM